MRRFISFLSIIILFAAAISVPVYAAVRSDDRITVRAEEVIDDDFFAAGDEVIIEGTVNGDVYVGANRLSIRGTVNGDVLAGAQNIEVSGVIRDDLRVGGNNITLIGAEIGDSVSVGGNELSIDGDTTIGGGLLFGGRSLSLDGSVGRGIATGNETTRIDGSVGKSVRVAATDITIDQDAVIAGDLEYRSDNEPVIDGIVTGQVVRGDGGGLDFEAESVLRWFVLGFTLWAFLAAAIIGGVMMLLAPRVFNRASEKFRAKPWQTVGWGLLALLATIPAAILLFVSIVGIPMAIIVLVLWAMSIYFAKFFTAHLVGESLLSILSRNSSKSTPRAYPALLLGLALYYLLRLLPGVGILVRFATVVVGLGLILSLYTRPRPKKAKV